MRKFIDKLDQQFIRFLFVGGINTLFGYAMFALFLFLHLHYAIASLFSTILGVLFNFKTTGKLVFKSNDNRLLVRFFAVYGIVYVLNVFSLKCLNLLKVDLYISGIILIFPLAIVSFLLNKKFVFKK
ncbi:MAG: GtrA family protein [Bacilli bacterium]|nr:GtrA family protein [Bacilli bacterium]